jgi:hypothetical protein
MKVPLSSISEKINQLKDELDNTNLAPRVRKMDTILLRQFEAMKGS